MEKDKLIAQLHHENDQLQKEIVHLKKEVVYLKEGSEGQVPCPSKNALWRVISIGHFIRLGRCTCPLVPRNLSNFN
jgi:hypothetical protein